MRKLLLALVICMRVNGADSTEPALLPAPFDAPDGIGLGVAGTFLYWLPNVDHVGANFKYHPGFRISADVHSDARGFFLQGCWTSFHPHDQGRWKLDYDIADLFLEPPYFYYKSFSFNPFIGFRGGRIDQLEQKFWCAGVSSGINVGWSIGAGISFFGDFLASLVYGQFRVGHDHLARFRPNLGSAFGLNWDYPFGCGKYDFSLSAAYEMAVWFNQVIASSGDLGMGGLSLNADLEF